MRYGPEEVFGCDSCTASPPPTQPTIQPTIQTTNEESPIANLLGTVKLAGKLTSDEIYTHRGLVLLVLAGLLLVVNKITIGTVLTAQSAILILIGYILGYYIRFEFGDHHEDCSGASAVEDKPGKGLLPLMSSSFNIREACKQSILLEDHLIQPRRRCKVCIRKHMLFYEALLEEAQTLNGAEKYKVIIEEMLINLKVCEKMFIDGQPYEAIGQRLRTMRNRVTADFFEVKE
jgi:hypothetical protein